MKKENTFYHSILELGGQKYIYDVEIDSKEEKLYTGTFKYNNLILGFLDGAYSGGLRMFSLVSKISVQLDRKKDKCIELEKELIEDLRNFPAISQFEYQYENNNSKISFRFLMQLPYKDPKDGGKDNILSLLEFLSMISMRISYFNVELSST